MVLHFHHWVIRQIEKLLIYFNLIYAGEYRWDTIDDLYFFTKSSRPVQLRYNRTVSKFGFRRLHEYVLKLVDVKKCPTMDEDCPEADRLDVTNCSSCKSIKFSSKQINRLFTYYS